MTMPDFVQEQFRSFEIGEKFKTSDEKTKLDKRPDLKKWRINFDTKANFQSYIIETMIAN